MNDAQNAFRAGIVIVIGTVIGVVFFGVSNKNKFAGNDYIPYYGYMTDAVGINPKSLITIAGLQVGKINEADLIPVKLGEYIPDLEKRLLTKYGVLTEEDERAPDHPDFDSTIQALIDRGRLPKPEMLGAQANVDEKQDGDDDKGSDKPKTDKEREAEREAERSRVAQRKDAARALVAQELPKLKNEDVVVARIDFVVHKKYTLPADSWMKKDSLGVLGANALFLERGISDKNIGPGDRVVNVRSLTPAGTLLAQAEGIVASVRGIVRDVEGITNTLDEKIGGIVGDVQSLTTEISRFMGDESMGDDDRLPAGGARDIYLSLMSISREVKDAIAQLNKDNKLDKLAANVERITADIADLTSKGDPNATGPDGGPAGEGDLRATMASVRKVADDLAVVTEQLKTMLGENEEEVGEGVKSLRETITELNRSLSSLSEVAGRVERGEGTVGRLLTDEKIADKVEAAVAGASDFVTSLTSLETHVDIGSWYNVNRGAATTTIGLKLQPKPDKFYLLEVVDDGGALESVREREVTTSDGSVIRESTREDDNSLRISAVFAKRFFDFLVLRVGLIETSGGVGANVFLLDNRIELRSDLFNIALPRDALEGDPLPPGYLPRWRTLVKAQPIPHFYVSAGVDDVLNSIGPGGFQPYSQQLGFGFDYFFGVGLTFRDEDLRSILPFIPGG